MSIILGDIQQAYYTAAQWSAWNGVLLAGQKGIESDTLKEKVGDGVTVWNSLTYSSVPAQNLSNVLTVGNQTGNTDIIQTGTSKFRNADSSVNLDISNPAMINFTNTDGFFTYSLDSDATAQFIQMRTYDNATNLELTYFQSFYLQANMGVYSGATGNRLTQLEITNGEIRTNIVNNLTFEGIKYDADFSANYTSRSLVDKGYVDGNFQPLDADLTSWAGITRAAGFDTFVATPSSANLASLVTDETGSGALVFGTSPTFTGYISIDNPSPFHKIDISADTQTGSEAIALTQYTAAAATSPQVFLRRARGSLATPTAITNNDDLGYYSFRGYDGSAFVGTKASISARASENWSSIANGTRLRFQVTTNGTTSAITPMELLDTGNLHLTLSTSSIYLGNITPSSTNYALGYTAANELSVNAISTMRLRVGGTIYGTLTATSLSLGNYLTLGNVGSDIKLYMQRTGGKNTRLETTTTSTRLYNESDTLMMWTAYNNGSFAPGLTSALATTATDGFLYVPSCAGIPTGVPTAITGKIAVVCDSTNNKMYIYSGGAWVALN